MRACERNLNRMFRVVRFVLRLSRIRNLLSLVWFLNVSAVSERVFAKTFRYSRSPAGVFSKQHTEKPLEAPKGPIGFTAVEPLDIKEIVKCIVPADSPQMRSAQPAVLSHQAILDGIQATPERHHIQVKWRYAANSGCDPSLVGFVFEWEGILIQKIGTPPTKALIFYPKQDPGQLVKEGIYTEMPRPGVEYLAITYRQPQAMDSQSVHQMHVNEVMRVQQASQQQGGPAFAQAPFAGGFSTSYVWWDPTTYADVPPQLLLMHLRSELGINDATPAGNRRRMFDILSKIIRGASCFPNWNRTELADGAADLIKTMRLATARDLGIDMDKLYKEIAEDEEDPLRQAMTKAGKKERAKHARNQRARGSCFTCGAVGHYSPDCPLKQTSQAPSSPKNGSAGGRRE